MGPRYGATAILRPLPLPAGLDVGPVATGGAVVGQGTGEEEVRGQGSGARVGG
jgi:hypothetical protein